MKLSSVYKLLKGPLQIEKVRCLTTGFKVEGPFELPALLQLSGEQIDLVETLVIAGGNLKKVAEILDMSYPTLKNRLDEVGRILKKHSEQQKQKRLAILEQLEAGDISPESAAEKIENL